MLCSLEETSPTTSGVGFFLNYPDALVKVADDQFAFTTAESGGGGEGMF